MKNKLALRGALAALGILTMLAGVPGVAVAQQPARVVTWNLFAPGEAEPDDYAWQIARVRPQVIGVQEACRQSVEDTAGILRTQYGLNYHVAYGTVKTDRWNCGMFGGNAFGQAILSMTPITDATNTLYSQGGSEPRGYMAVTTTVNGTPTRIFNTHLAQADQAAIRGTQVRELMRATSAYNRAIVLGDFNTEPQSTEIAPIWRRFRDADPDCGPQQNSDCTPTADASPNRKKFDYVLLLGITPPEVTTINSVHSDHDLVIADLR